MKNILIVKIQPYALGNTKEKVKFYVSENSATNTIIPNRADNEENSIEIEMTTIDDFVRENNIEKVDFIKADIEGAERYMLEGAKETITKFSPKLSICTYHLPDDCEVLERIIKEYNDKYVVVHKWKNYLHMFLDLNLVIYMNNI